jgi:hypothetical protein
MTEARQPSDGGLRGVVAQMGIVSGSDSCVGMSQQLGNCEQVHAQLRQRRSIGVTQFVEADFRFNLGLLAGKFVKTLFSQEAG